MFNRVYHPVIIQLGTVRTWAQALVCVPKAIRKQGYYRWRNIVDIQLISTLNIISVIFLSVLLTQQWKLQRHKLFGALKLCTISMLLIFNITLTALKFQGNESSEIIYKSKVNWIYNEVKENWPILCLMEGLVLQYSFLSALLWLNTMSFDIWSNFRRLRPSGDILRRQQGLERTSGFRHPKFKKYALYAWGIPFVNLGITLLMDFLPQHITEGYVVPGIGKKRCATQEYMVSHSNTYIIYS